MAKINFIASSTNRLPIGKLDSIVTNGCKRSNLVNSENQSIDGKLYNIISFDTQAIFVPAIIENVRECSDHTIYLKLLVNGVQVDLSQIK